MKTTKPSGKPKTILVIEYHYKDGDIGAHFIEKDTDVHSLWNAASTPSNLSHFIIRAATNEEIKGI